MEQKVKSSALFLSASLAFGFSAVGILATAGDAWRGLSHAFLAISVGLCAIGCVLAVRNR